MSQQHTKIDYLTITGGFPIAVDAASKAAQMLYLAELPIRQQIAHFTYDAHVVEFYSDARRSRSAFSLRCNSTDALRKKAEFFEKVFAESVGYERPLQYTSAPPEILSVESRGSLQKEFTKKSLEMLAPLFGGKDTLNNFLLDCIIVSLSKIYGKKWDFVQRSGKKFFYKNWGELTIDGMPSGLIAWDYENLGFMISLTGAGCAATDMTRVHRLLTHPDMVIFKPKISRVDIALDDLSGEKINYFRMREIACDGFFTPPRGAAPRYSCIESGHVVVGKFNRKKGVLEPHTKLDFFPDLGCSLYVGARESGKMCRGYEKGIQLECAEHPRWFRVEYELRSVDRVLPPEILIKSDDFFCGCSAAAAKIFSDVTEAQAEPVHILTFRAQIHAGVEHVKKFAALQCARAVVWMREVEEMTDSQIVDFLIERLDGRCEKDRIPKRLAVPVPYAALPNRGPEPRHRPSTESTNTVSDEIKTIDDFYAAVAAA